MGAKQDVAKARHWQNIIREAARSGVSIREFCRQRQVTVSQFYWWQRRLKQRPAWSRGRKPMGAGSPASFVLVSEDGQSSDAGIELVLGNGRRLRIHKGVDETTLRTVLATMEGSGC